MSVIFFSGYGKIIHIQTFSNTLKISGESVGIMTVSKTQHYVPRSYLKRFALDNDSLYVFDKIQRKVFKSNVTNVACERYFYELPENGSAQVGIDTQAVEKLLADIDEGFSRTVENILMDVTKQKKRKMFKRKVINRDQKLAMAYFLTIQMLRTREQRDLLTESTRKMGEALLSKMPNYSPDDYQIEVDEQWIATFQSQFMLSPNTREKFISALYNHIWFIGINKTEQPFYSSDNPIVKRAHINDPLKSYSGIASKGIEIALPLNPRCILVLCDRSVFKRLKRFDCKLIDTNSDNVTYYNSLQVVQSNRQIYSPTNTFKLAETICDEHPEICELERERLHVS